jgi:stage IV sporulation protein FB
MRIVFHPVFLLVAAISLLGGFGVYILAGVLAVLIHESAHAAAASHFGIRAAKITLLPFGARLSIGCAFLPRKSQSLILLAGAMGNAAAGVFAASFMWLWPWFFDFIGLFIVANVSVAVLNLLPVYPLDGGKIIELFCGRGPARALLAVSNIAFAALLVLGLVWFHWALVVFAACMLFSVNTDSKNEYVSKLCKSAAAKSGPVREVAVRSDMTLFDVFRAVDRRHYTKFIVTDRGNRPFFESDLEVFLTSYALDTRLVDII